MKKRLIIIGVVIIAVGFTAFGLMTRLKLNDDNDLKLQSLPVSQYSSAISNFGISQSEIYYGSADVDLWYSVRGKYDFSITEKKLRTANTLGDVISNYPENWITDYRSVEVSRTYNGFERKATGSDEVFTLAQKDIIRSAGLADEIIITIKYNTKNVVTNETVPEHKDYSVTVIPEKEAEYIGGYDQMITWLRESSLNQISPGIAEQIQPSSFLFSVNKQGEIEDVRMNKTTGDASTDKMFIELIKNMPKWEPAINSGGGFVKQKFEFNVGMDGC